MAVEKKGIVLKKEKGQRKLMLHPETLHRYLSTLEPDERGWVVFDITPVPKINKGIYARINPPTLKQAG